MEPEGTRSTGDDAVALGAELDRIEAAVRDGNLDLSALGYWRIVTRIKRDPSLVDRFADQAARIDTSAFRQGVKLRAAVWAGNLAMAAVLVAGVVGIAIAASTDGVLSGLALLAAGGAWSLGVHAPAHWLFGRAVGIRFTDYFLGGPPPPRPGIKTDYATYLRTPAGRRAWFHASGAIATKVAPFVAVALAPLTNAPAWSVVLMAAYGVLQIVTDLLFSVKTSDWKKFRRERAIARSLATV